MNRSEPTKPAPSRSPLAIVGMGCRFPGGADDVESFWQMVAEGRSGIREVPADRWNRDRYYHPDSGVPGAMITKWGGFVENLDRFDAHFWGITPREAMRMDPQQRWLLEVSWEAIEDSGMPPASLRGTNAGVFVGIAGNDYGGLQMPNFAGTDVHTNSGCTLSIAANRISYLLDLRGPSVSVDTACSSALVAVWAACRSIWDGCCDSALAGGVNALITPHATIGFSKASMLSPSGQCFAFDARANGYVRGEGAGMVFIKPLDRAIADGDPIYAIIRAAASNQDGHTSSMTVPGVEGQSALLRQAYEEAGISPVRVVYMEAHGTGTPVGDPIEATALGRVLGEGRPADQPCLMGSVKTNIGHLEAGSGIAGLIKAALVLHKDMVPPNRGFEKPNPYIPFQSLGLEVVRELRRLPHQNGVPPVTAVNSFGFGGTNAHVVLEQGPAERKRPDVSRHATRPLMLPISARDDVALRKYVEAYRTFLANSTVSLADVCYSAGERKDHHAHRLVVLADDAAQMTKRLGAWLRTTPNVEGVVTGKSAAKPSAPVFVFTGQGAQWWAMGRELLRREPVFRKIVEEIDRLLRTLGEWSLIEEMSRDEKDSNIDRTDIAQPAIFALQVGLAELWKSWGIQPAKVIGHSVGEVAAAYCAGIYSLEDAVKVIYHRSRLQNTTGGHGRMLAAGISPAEGRRLIGDAADRVHVAVINSSNLITLAGDTEPLEEIAKQLEQTGKFNRWLRIQYAFHTHQMDPIKDELLAVLADICPRPASIPFISTVTGGTLNGERLDALYWWKNVRHPVLFGPAIANLIRGNANTFLEIGPHPALTGSISDCLKDQGRTGVVFYSLRRGADESLEMLTNLAGLHIAGMPVDWATVNQSAKNFVRLPQYPWNREPYWLESEESQRARLASVEHPMLGTRVAAAQPTWQFELHPRRFDYLKDHRLWDSIVLPGACYAEIGIALARTLFPDDPHAVEDLEMKKAFFISEDQPPTVQVVFDPETKAYFVYSRSEDKAPWDLNAQGRLTRFVVREQPQVDLEALRQPLTEHLDNAKYYEDMLAAGYQFGPNFKELQNCWRVHGEALTEIVVPEDIQKTFADYHFQPAVLDACFHIFKGLKVDPGARPEENFHLPHSVHRVFLYTDKPPAHCWAHGKLISDDGKAMVSDIFVYDDQGRRIADIIHFRVDKAEPKRSADTVENCYYQFRWEPRRLRGSRVKGSCAFPNTAELTKAARADIEELNKEHDLASYRHRYAPRVDALVCQAVQNAWLTLGWKPHVGERFRAQQLIDRLGIIESYHRLARAQLRDLAKHGFLRAAGEDEWEVIRLPQRGETGAEWEALAREYPRFVAEVVLNQLTGPNLAAVMSGEKDPLELLFPGGSQAHLEKFYTEAVDFPALMAIAQKAAVRTTANLPRRRVLRVLEIGAGTGGLTKALLPAFPADSTEYTFTDIGPAFVSAAKKRFAEYPFVDYRTFDIEKDPKAQGIEPGSFDLIVGSLVLHATADLKQVLANLRSCLTEGGILLFLEVFPQRHAWDNIFGLLPGWWRFTDAPLRQHSPLLDRGQWLKLLTESGFSSPGSFGTFVDERESELAFLFSYAAADSEAKEEAKPEMASDGTYLVLADNQGVADALGQRLKQRGNRVVQVRRGKEFKRTNENDFSIASDSESDLCRVFADVEVATNEFAGIIHCWSIDHPKVEGMSLDALRAAQQTGVLNVVRLLHTVAAAPPSLVYSVTRGMYSIGGDASTSLASSPLVGLLRVAANEYYPTRFSVVDLDAKPNDDEIDDLLDEVIGGDGETEIGYRGDRRHVLRLGRLASDHLPVRTRNAVNPDGSVAPFRLQTSRPGVLTNLSLNETVRRDPGPGDIEIRVRAGGINFRDVLKALAQYPGNPIDLLWFGDDVSGTVERVGTNVKHLKPGDEVVGIVPYAFQAYVTADARMVFKKTKRMSFEQAATLPTVFLTAHYAINHLARMRKGESILIHAGTGGVGLAAIQIAKHLGLEIFATAGSDEKRKLLRDMGVHHIMNSRTLEFADKVMEITKGRGVDAVLNSLAGDFIPKSMSVLAPFGRFMEIGKIDIYKNTKIGLEPFKSNVSYFVIDLTGHFQHRQDFVAEMFHDLEARFAAGDYQPLLHTVFPITKAVDAFRHMAQGKHVGKNVLSFNVNEIAIGPCTQEDHRFRGEASYLITGGAGGFGLELAKWMSRRGARNLVLMSRSGPRDDASKNDIEQLRAAGINVLDARGDVTKLEDVTAIVKRVAAEMPPLRGVIHAAMILDDDFIAALDDARFLTALEPKVAGAWNLHVATKDIPLEHFVCCSSISAVAGIPKQSSYNAGNYFLDALAHYRHAIGMPALTIDWGALLGAGFVERNKKTADFLDKIGMKAFNMEEALRVFSQMMLADPVQTAAARLDWRALSKACPSIAKAPTYDALIRESSEAERGGSLVARLQGASPDSRPGLVEDLIVSQVAGVFGITEDKVDRETPLTNLGLDSLMAVELTNRLEREIGSAIPMGSLLGGPSIKALSQTVLRLVSHNLAADVSAESGAAIESASADLPPLEKAIPASEEFPLSERQQALWKLCRQDPGNPAFTLTFAAKLRPTVNVEAMRRSFAALVRRHPMLTVTFSEAGGKPLQRLHKSVYLPFREHDVRDIGADQIKQRLTNHAGRAFNLERGPVVRLDLFRTRDGSHIALLAAHRLVADAKSLTTLVKELFDGYEACQAGLEPRREAGAFSYQDFVAWESKHLASPSGKRLADFWKRQLKDAPLYTDLPTDRARPPVQTLRGAAFGFKLDDELTQKVLALAAEQNVSLRTTLLSAYQLLMHRWCHQGDLVIGCVLAGREHRELSDVVGSFGHPMPVRSRVDDDPTVEEFLKRANQNLGSATENQHFSLPRLVHELNVPADLSRPPLVQVCFAMEGAAVDEPAIPVFLLGQAGYKFHTGGLIAEAIDLPAKEAACELTLAMEDADGCLYGSWEYNCDIFEPATIARINDLFARTLHEISRSACKHVSELARDGFPATTGTVRRKDWATVTSRHGADGADCAADARLDPAITPPPNVPAQLGKMDRVLLTGSTGYLGAFLLDELLRETDAQVLCVVRAKTPQQGYDRIVENLQNYGLMPPALQSRLVPVVGDLEKPLLGLSESEFQRLSSEVDAIIHSGAIVNLITPYEMLRGTNVNGTREVLRLACKTRPKPVHYVSTFGVLAASDRHPLSVASEDEPLPPFEKLPVGYTRSKWVCETMLQQARSRGLPVTIYRPGNIAGHSRTGACNSTDFLHTLVLTCWRIRSVPEIDLEADVTPVDYVSQAIVQLARRPECFGRTYHLVNPQPLRLPRLVEWMQTVGADVELVQYGWWYKKLVALVDGAPDEVVAPLMQLLGPIDPSGEAPRSWHPRYDCQNAVSSLTACGISCPPMDDQLLNTYLSYAIRSGRVELKKNNRGKLLASIPAPREQ